jgi:hypothetical protein
MENADGKRRGREGKKENSHQLLALQKDTRPGPFGRRKM